VIILNSFNGFSNPINPKEKVNFIFYFLQGNNYDESQHNFFTSIFDSVSQDDKYVLTAFAKSNRLVHFNDYKKLTASKKFLFDSIHDFSLLNSLKNNFSDLESAQLSLYDDVSKIYNYYHFEDAKFDLDFYIVLDIVDSKSLNDFENSKLIAILNGFRLLNLLAENNYKTKIILNTNKAIRNKSFRKDLKNYLQLSFNPSNYEFIIK
jgi:hypothetical protein